MQQYLELLEDVLAYGKLKSKDPQGIGSIAVGGRLMRFRMSNGFPILTTKKIVLKYVLGELLWFLRGERRIDFLQQHRIPIWDPWGKEAPKYGLLEGDVGPIYGPQWVRWQKRDGGEINQIVNLVEGLKTNPDSRRHMVSSWNPEDVDNIPVAPCHGIFKCFASDGMLDLHMFQRSADVFIGVPYNISSYSLLLLMLAQVTGLKPGEFVHFMSDTHLYLNHIEQAKLQLTRQPRPLPRLWINPNVTDIFKFTFEDFQLEGYDPHPYIPAPVGV